MAFVDSFAARVDVLDYDTLAAEHTGQLRAELAWNGQLIGSSELLIAGHARSQALIIVLRMCVSLNGCLVYGSKIGLPKASEAVIEPVWLARQPLTLSRMFEADVQGIGCFFDYLLGTWHIFTV